MSLSTSVNTARTGDAEDRELAIAAIIPKVKRGSGRATDSKHRRPEAVYQQISLLVRQPRLGPLRG